ncbi:hypothetical protein ACRRTK_015131 [Alexandromys fortis]
MAVEELQSIIKRCQILEEHDFKEEDFGLFQLAGQRCIEDGHVDQLLEIIQEEKNKTVIKSMGWNLVGPVVRCLLRNGEEDERKDCLLVFDLLVKLLTLVSVAVIQKLPNKVYSVGLALSTLWSQLSLLPVPYSKEQIQTDDYGLCQCCEALTEFMRPFVEEATENKENKENEKLKDELLKFCCKCLKCPLLTAQFLKQSEEVGKDPFWSFASEIIPVAPFAAEHGTHRSASAKELLENSLLRLEDNSLLHRYLEIKSFLAVPQRKKGLALLQLYIDKLDSQGKHTLFRCLLNTSNHSGVEGFVIQNIKNQIDASFKKTSNKWFAGPQLISLLDLVLSLPEGAETDLLQNSDRIMASLNLLRYLVIKDNENDNQVLHSALFTFDLIESVLARVEELIEIKTKSTSEENVGIK